MLLAHRRPVWDEAGFLNSSSNRLSSKDPTLATNNLPFYILWTEPYPLQRRGAGAMGTMALEHDLGFPAWLRKEFPTVQKWCPPSGVTFPDGFKGTELFAIIWSEALPLLNRLLDAQKQAEQGVRSDLMKEIFLSLSGK